MMYHSVAYGEYEVMKRGIEIQQVSAKCKITYAKAVKMVMVVRKEGLMEKESNPQKNQIRRMREK